MKLRRNGRGSWQATSHVKRPDGTELWDVRSSGGLLHVLLWHWRFVRNLKRGSK